jgi:hypothetical protein
LYGLDGAFQRIFFASLINFFWTSLSTPFFKVQLVSRESQAGSINIYMIKLWDQESNTKYEGF